MATDAGGGAEARPLLCYAVHVEGGQTVDTPTGHAELPTFGAGHESSAVYAAAQLKAADPDTLVTLVVWTDDGEDWIARTSDQVGAALGEVVTVAAAWREQRRAEG